MPRCAAGLRSASLPPNRRRARVLAGSLTIGPGLEVSNDGWLWNDLCEEEIKLAATSGREVIAMRGYVVERKETWHVTGRPDGSVESGELDTASVVSIFDL